MVAVPAIALLYPLLASLGTDSNYTILNDDYGTVHLIENNEPEFTQAEFIGIGKAAEKTAFYLYTRNNPIVGQQLFIDDLESVKNSFWNPEHPTRLITHGWRGNIESTACLLIRDAYLSIGNYNVILIDWRDAAKSIVYWPAVKSVPLVAQRMASMMDFLENNVDLDPDRTKLIGFSLGAHVVGLAARFAVSEIAEVVALDPAKQAYTSKGPGERVDESDAAHVQVIHTCTSGVGLEKSVGTSDFYPNGGEEQPGCGSIRWIGNIKAINCAHSRAYMYYVESIMNPKGFRAGEVFMGGPSLDPNARGTYVLQTASESPFALG